MEPTVSAMMAKVRQTNPLVHHITNYVTVNDCANICICAGGAPVMTDAAEDVPDMAAHASAVVLNIGTLNARTVDSMVLAGKAANRAHVPVVLDPVGVGATPYRTATAERILREVNAAVIKGNAGEISVLAGLGGAVRGVDSAGAGDPGAAARKLAARTGTVVAATGPVDYVADTQHILTLRNGCNLLEKVSGTGCMVASVVGCYVGACGVSADSVAAAISVFNIAAELANVKADGPGTFRAWLLDAMNNLTGEQVDARLRMA